MTSFRPSPLSQQHELEQCRYIVARAQEVIHLIEAGTVVPAWVKPNIDVAATEIGLTCSVMRKK